MANGLSEGRRRRYLEAMGVVSWESRGRSRAPEQAPAVEDAPVGDVPVGDGSGITAGFAPPAPVAAALARLEEEVAACTRCALHATRNRTVFGVGHPQAACMVVGEGPGADEDRQGEPFVGRAGRLLDAMLAAIGLAREVVYIANIVKCRPPGNRDPRPEEVASCGGYLRAQIDSVRPRLLVAVGRVAAQNLLGRATPLSRLRGGLHQHPDTGTPVLVTYHPAYLLRSPREKRKAWEDLKRVRAFLLEAGP